MTNIITGTVERRFQYKSGKSSEETANDDENFSMEHYNSGLIFGSKSELVAFRLNKQLERKFIYNCKLIDSEQKEFNRIYEKTHYDNTKKNQKLTTTQKQFISNLAPEVQERYERLYLLNNFKPVPGHGYTNGTRIKSASQISQKARQLNLDLSIFSPPCQTSSTQISRRPRTSLGHNVSSRRNTSFNMHKVPDKNLMIDEILNGPDNTRIRVTIINNQQKVSYLTWQQHYSSAIKIENAPLIPELSSAKIVKMTTNIHPLNPEYNLEPTIYTNNIQYFQPMNIDSTKSANQTQPDIHTQHNTPLPPAQHMKSMKQRCLSAQPKKQVKIRPISAVSSLPVNTSINHRHMIHRETQYGDKINKIVSQFLQSLD